MTDETVHADADAFVNLSKVAQLRADLFQLLAVGFADPTPVLAEGLKTGSYYTDLKYSLSLLNCDDSHFGKSLSQLEAFCISMSDEDSRDILRDLKVEYARLFIGPGPCVVSPYQTSYCDSRNGTALLMISPSAQAVQKAYREASVDLVADLNEPPDHIATELEFLMYLCSKEAAAWKTQTSSLGKKWRRSERQFIDDHLGRWVVEFCHQVHQESRHEFYKAISSITAIYLRIEQGAYKPA